MQVKVYNSIGCADAESYWCVHDGSWSGHCRSRSVGAVQWTFCGAPGHAQRPLPEGGRQTEQPCVALGWTEAIELAGLEGALTEGL
jgi:hypothetical protein